MKLIIDISEEEYNRIKGWEDNITGYQTSLALYRAVRASIPYEERPQGDLKSCEALKAHARKVICGDNPTNSLLIRMFDEIINNAPTVSDRYDEGYADGYFDGGIGADMKGGAE